MGDDFERCDLNGDGEIRGRLESQALWRHSIGEAGLQPMPRAWHDPLVVSNALFALAALQWCRRGHRRQGALLLGCALSSWVYHAGGEATPGWPLLVDECFAYTTFAHTLLFPARRLDRSSVPGLCVSPPPPPPPTHTSPPSSGPHPAPPRVQVRADRDGAGGLAHRQPAARPQRRLLVLAHAVARPRLFRSTLYLRQHSCCDEITSGALATFSPRQGSTRTH